MTNEVHERLFSPAGAFADPMTVAITIALAVVLAVVPLIVLALTRMKKVTPEHSADLWLRYRSWLILVPLMLVPILLGAAWTIAGITLLALLCYREFARATGLFREKLVSLVVVISIFAIMFAAFDHWYHFFVALIPLTFAVLSAAAILPDRPKGYIQRVGLGTLAFAFFGAGMGHLAYICNDANYRPILLMLLVTVEANDVFAYVSGKTLGRHKLAPNTSPNKTVEGALGALMLTTLLFALLAHRIYAGTPLNQPLWLVLLGAIVSFAGQMGDLTFSSIKRDLGIKDSSNLIPGHGGLLDRFDSLILVAPAFFHFVGYFVGFGLDQPTRILTGD